MAYPVLPEQEQKELDSTAGKFAFLIHTQQYPEAQNVAAELFNSMLKWQKQHGKRFHKGYPIHNVGYALHLQNKDDEALLYFILAYIEDLLSADNEDDADSTPAGQTLLLGYKLVPELFSSLKQLVSKLKKDNNIPQHPAEVLSELEKFRPNYEGDIKNKAVKPKGHPQRPFNLFDTEWETRVFIGGSGDAIINIMRDIVEKIGGYDPVVVVDFNMPKEMTIYHKCLALLHSCKYAIFDLSIQGGQIIEIERAPDYGVKTLAVWQADKEHTITQVLKSCLEDRKIKYKSYSDFSELENIFREFLIEN